MKAKYYAIYEYDNLTCRKGNIVEEGILGENDDIIYFEADGYIIEVNNFEITREVVFQNLP